MREITEMEWEAVLETEEYMEEREKYCERMKSEGYKILVPEKDELFIDIDSEEDYKHFSKMITRVMKEFTGITFTEKPSKSGLPKRHIVVRWPWEIENIERITWQAILGSDRTREMLSMFRMYNEDPVPTLFAEKEL